MKGVIETLMEDAKAKVNEKNQLDCQEKWKLISLSAVSALSRFRRKE